MPYGPALGRFAGWAAATTVSALTGWAALQPVLNTAVPDRVQLLTGAELRAEATMMAPEVTPEAIIATPSDTPAPQATSDPGPDEDPPATPPADSDDPEPDQAPPADSSGGDSDDPPTDPPSDSPVVVDGWTQVDHGAGSTSYVQTFETDGGTATIEVEEGQATLISATPNEPYSVDVYHEDPERVVVKFFWSDRMWVIDAMWWEGRPYAPVSEVS
jgi:hypothetical protein